MKTFTFLLITIYAVASTLGNTIKHTAADTTQKIVEAQRPPYTKKINGVKYELLKAQNGKDLATDKTEADKACKNLSKSLLTVQSKTDSDSVAHWLYIEHKLKRSVWLSLKRVDNTDDFSWPDGKTLKFRDTSSEAAFRNWHPCEPNHRTSTGWGFPANWDEDCVQMRPAFRKKYPDNYTLPHPCDAEGKAGEWNDIPCNIPSSLVVCQS